MRIVYLLTGFEKGGAEVQVDLLARAFAKNHEVHVIALVTPKIEWMEETPYTFHSLGMTKSAGAILSIFRLYFMLARLSPDLVHAHLSHAILLARLFRRAIGYRLICTAHNSVTEGLVASLCARTNKWCDLNTHVAENGRALFIEQGMFGDDAITVPNGIPIVDSAKTDSRSNAVIGEVTFGFLAKLRSEKNIRLLLSAFKEHLTRHPPSRLEIAGEGPEMIVIESFLSQNPNAAKRVSVRGLVRDPVHFLQSVDVILLTSDREGLPLALIEAGMCGLPAIATDVGGVSEIVEDGKSGFLVPSKDEVAFTNAMNRMAALSRNERRRFGEEARQIALARYSLPAVIRKWQAIYGEHAKCSVQGSE